MIHENVIFDYIILHIYYTLWYHHNSPVSKSLWLRNLLYLDNLLKVFRTLFFNRNSGASGKMNQILSSSWYDLLLHNKLQVTTM